MSEMHCEYLYELFQCSNLLVQLVAGTEKPFTFSKLKTKSHYGSKLSTAKLSNAHKTFLHSKDLNTWNRMFMGNVLSKSINHYWNRNHSEIAIATFDLTDII